MLEDHEPDSHEAHEGEEPGKGGRTARLREILAIIQSVLTILAIAGAGTWFFLQATTEPKANIKYEVTHRQLSKDYVWVRAEINITNIGKRPLTLPSGIFRLQQVLPLPPEYVKRLESQTLVDRERLIVLWPQFEGAAYEKDLNLVIYPGETDVLDCEFIIPASAQTVKLYSFFPAEKNAKQGWKGSVIYDIKKAGT